MKVVTCELVPLRLLLGRRGLYQSKLKSLTAKINLDTKFAAKEKAGMGRIVNFRLPFVEQQLKKCEAG